MAWRRPGDKPLSKPMIVSLLTHICVTRPQWVNYAYFTVIQRGAEVHSVKTWAYLASWCPGSMDHQDISRHDIGCVTEVDPCVSGGRTSTTSAILVFRNDRKCEYIFMIPKITSAKQGLRGCPQGIAAWRDTIWLWSNQDIWPCGVSK